MNLRATNSVMTFLPGRKVPSNIYVPLYLHPWKGNHNLALLFSDSVFCSSPFPPPMVQKSSLQNRCKHQEHFLEFSILCFDKHPTISLYNFPQFNTWDNQWWGDYKVKNHKSKARGKRGGRESSCQNTQTRKNRPDTCIMRLHINFDNQHSEGNKLHFLVPKRPKPTPSRTTMI